MTPAFELIGMHGILEYGFLNISLKSACGISKIPLRLGHVNFKYLKYFWIKEGAGERTDMD